VSRLQLTYGGYVYLDRTRALQTGQVQPKGVDLNVQVVEISELFRRTAQHAEFDIAEMSLSTYLMMLGQGDERLIGIPVFLSRAFRHSMVFVNAGAGIDEPSDLRGKRVGTPEYQMTAGLWIRGFLQHDYGVKPSDLEWWYGGSDEPGYAERRHHDAPPGVRLERIPAGKTLSGMLDAGELDAMITAAKPAPFRNGSPNVRRLFADPYAVERDYFRRTGLFPIMHLVVLRRELYEANRWLAASILDAFIESKRLGLERLRLVGALPVAVPWLAAAMEEVDELFGGDAFPYGFEQNRTALEAATTYSYEQGLTPRRFEPAELFAPETLDHPGDDLRRQAARLA
jgi:4,5-dihydroxyphthalate decarboxylase